MNKKQCIEKKYTNRLTVLLLILLSGPIYVLAQVDEKPNIIFIVADDLNDYIESLVTSPDVETPNINRIADLGTTFFNAYCPSPLCCPSRTSFMTGKDTRYTDVYSAATYNCHDFSGNFKPASNNDEYFT